ncbi:MAG: TRAP transporter small permease subunit [Dongiaceae bacterium]
MSDGNDGGRPEEGRPVALLLAVLGGIAFAAMLGATALGTIVRYLLAGGFEWSFEAAAFSFIWVSFLGVLLADLRGDNMSFDSIVAALPGGAQRGLALLRTLLLLLLGAVLLRSGLAMVAQTGATPSPVLRWPMAVTGLAVPLLGAGLIGFALARLARGLRAGRGVRR